jgi:phage host-nuclease inhibitor protein Gam
VTFIDELLQESEAADMKNKLEMNKLRADQLLMAISVLEEKLDEVSDLAKKEIALIEEFRTSETEKLNKKIYWLTLNLEHYIRSSVDKTINLHQGHIKLRLGRDKVEIDDMEMFLKTAAKRGFLKTIPESYEPDLQAIVEHVHRTGEIPHGVTLTPAQTKFSYKTIKGETNEQRKQTEAGAAAERISQSEVTEG